LFSIAVPYIAQFFFSTTRAKEAKESQKSSLFGNSLLRFVGVDVCCLEEADEGFGTALEIRRNQL
jgi:hypothetical protein